MPITGETISRAGERTARLEGAAIRDERRKQALQHEAARQALYKLQNATGSVHVAEADLARIRREADYLDRQIAEAREVAVQTGHRAANLHVLSFQAAESPALVAAAVRRLEVACAQLANAQAAFNATQEPEPEPVKKGRGR